MTYLSSLHPYPAMIANELATTLAERFVAPGNSVLDPFCGTGRTLLASQSAHASQVVGVDVNPLATLIAQAKFAPASERRIRRLGLAPLHEASKPLDFESRKVSWFSTTSRAHLTAIIRVINRAD